MEAYTLVVRNRSIELLESQDWYQQLNVQEQRSVINMLQMDAERETAAEAEARAAAPAPSQILCGQLVKSQGLVYPIHQLKLVDMEGDPMGSFYVDEPLEPEDGYADCRIFERGAFLCVVVDKVTPNNLGLEPLGVREKTIRWVRSCSVPN